MKKEIKKTVEDKIYNELHIMLTTFIKEQLSLVLNRKITRKEAKNALLCISFYLINEKIKERKLKNKK
jgi:hypothetical protein